MRKLMIYVIIGVRPNLDGDLNNFLGKIRATFGALLYRAYIIISLMNLKPVNWTPQTVLIKQSSTIDHPIAFVFNETCAGRNIVSPIIRYTFEFYASLNKRLFLIPKNCVITRDTYESQSRESERMNDALSHFTYSSLRLSVDSQLCTRKVFLSYFLNNEIYHRYLDESYFQINQIISGK